MSHASGLPTAAVLLLVMKLQDAVVVHVHAVACTVMLALLMLLSCMPAAALHVVAACVQFKLYFLGNRVTGDPGNPLRNSVTNCHCSSTCSSRPAMALIP